MPMILMIEDKFGRAISTYFKTCAKIVKPNGTVWQSRKG